MANEVNEIIYDTSFSSVEIEKALYAMKARRFSFDVNSILSIKKIENVLWAHTPLFVAKFQFVKDPSKNLIQIRVRYIRFLYFITFSIVIFFAFFLFAGNVTIHQNPDPSIWLRIGFFVLSLLIWIFPVALVMKLKDDFQNKLVQKLQLQRIKHTPYIS